MRLQFGTSVIDALGGWQAAFALSAVRADDEFHRVVPVASPDSHRLPETVWTEGTASSSALVPCSSPAAGSPARGLGALGCP